jgi:hypothetical protein
LQLSAGCMCGIFLFSGRMQEWMMDTRRLGRGTDLSETNIEGGRQWSTAQTYHLRQP